MLVFLITCSDSFAPSLDVALSLGASVGRLLTTHAYEKHSQLCFTLTPTTPRHRVPMHCNQRKVTSPTRHQHGGKFAKKHECKIKLTFQTSSFSAALHFTRELVFGILAILGCIMVQCLILAFILLSKAQVRFVLLQAQMLRQLYGRPSASEQRPSADGNRPTKKATNVKGDSQLHVRIEHH